MHAPVPRKRSALWYYRRMIFTIHRRHSAGCHIIYIHLGVLLMLIWCLLQMPLVRCGRPRSLWSRWWWTCLAPRITDDVTFQPSVSLHSHLIRLATLFSVIWQTIPRSTQRCTSAAAAAVWCDVPCVRREERSLRARTGSPAADRLSGCPAADQLCRGFGVVVVE